MNIPIAEPKWLETTYDGFVSEWRWDLAGYYLQWNKVDLQTLRLYYWDDDWRSDSLCAQGPANILAHIMSDSAEEPNAGQVVGHVLYLLGERSISKSTHPSWLTR